MSSEQIEKAQVISKELIKIIAENVEKNKNLEALPK